MENNEFPKIIGIGGLACSGKDLFYKISKRLLSEKNLIVDRLAFADELKKDLDSFLIDKANISAFTNNPQEKKLIRPFIVAYSTTLIRKIDPYRWISKLKAQIECYNRRKASYYKSDLLIITDCRFKNECDYIHSIGGKVIHLKKYNIVDDKKIYDDPPNEEERENDPLVENASDYKIEWEDIKSKINDENLLPFNEYLSGIVKEILSKVITDLK